MGSDADVLFAGLAALSGRVRTREVSPVALVEAALARADAAGRLGWIVTLTAERARAAARDAEAEIGAGRWRGPLHGIPCGLEDLVDTRGVRTTRGARPYAERVPERDATVAARLAEAGAVLVAKLATIELGGRLGYGTPAASLSGPCRNPWDPDRWAGGAAGGPAAAVAAGVVPFAIGVDVRGSLTDPAAFCGVTALRPTYGVLPRTGVGAGAYTFAVPGPVARSADDCAAVLATLAGADPRDPSSIAPPRAVERVRPELARGLRVGVLAAAPGREPLPAAAAALASAQDVLAAGGAIVEPAELPALPFEEIAAVLLEAEAANALEDVVRSGRTRELDDPSHRGKGPDEYAPRATSADYVRAARLRGEAQRAMARLLERHDLLLAPNLPVLAPRVGDGLAPLRAPGDPLGAAVALAGLPAAAIPIGFARGLPLSALIVGPPLEEARLLSAAASFQARTSHHLQRPPQPPVRPGAAAVTRR
ncbi:MAG TPA: amidase [Anaeromyxobacter sp.]|nr:amidase [Anaeromyxobacter sp.]